MRRLAISSPIPSDPRHSEVPVPAWRPRPGPILGAFIVGADIAGLSWRPMFLINIVLGTAGLALAWKVLPRTSGSPHSGELRRRRWTRSRIHPLLVNAGLRAFGCVPKSGSRGHPDMITKRCG